MKLFDQNNITFDPIDVDIKAEDDIIHLRFSYQDGLDFDEIPMKSFSLATEEVLRKNELWKKTCFELFIEKKNSNSYYEVNFSPARKHWNAYIFNSYRSPLKETTDIIFESANITPRETSLFLKIPKDNFSFHPKMILYRPTSMEPVYLSNLPHPKSGPDFHVFSVD